MLVQKLLELVLAPLQLALGAIPEWNFAPPWGGSVVIVAPAFMPIGIMAVTSAIALGYCVGMFVWNWLQWAYKMLPKILGTGS